MSLALTGINMLSPYNTNSLQNQLTSQQMKIQSQQSEIQDQQQELQKYQTKVQQQQQQIQEQDLTVQSQNQKLQYENVKRTINPPSKQQAIASYQSNQISAQIPRPASMTMPLNLLA